MIAGPYKHRQKSRLRALDQRNRTELREKALEMAQKGLNRRGGPVDQGSPQAQKQAADRMRNERAQDLGEMERQKQIEKRAPQSDQREARRSFQLRQNKTSNERSGQLFRTIPKKGGEVHEYQSGKRVFVRKPAASRTTGPTGGTYNRGLKPSGGSAAQGTLEKLVAQRVNQNRPKARRKLFSRG